MLAQGSKRSQYDSCVYINFINGSHLYIYCYMLIIAKSKKKITTLKSELSIEFEMKDLGDANKILIMEITRDAKSSLLFLSRKNYITKVLQILICMMQSLVVHLLILTSNCQHCNVLVMVKILSICHEFHKLVPWCILLFHMLQVWSVDTWIILVKNIEKLFSKFWGTFMRYPNLAWYLARPMGDLLASSRTQLKTSKHYSPFTPCLD
jgi:hypothetical protein